MKHIKTFESNRLYNIGDYVLLRPVEYIRTTTAEDIPDIYKNYGYIIYFFLGRVQYMYDINYIDENDFIVKNISSIYIVESNIIRKLTPEEIDDFKLTPISKKYNL